MKPKEILLQFHSAISLAHRRRIMEQFGLTMKEEILPQRISVASCPGESDLSALIDKLKALPEVAHVELNAEVNLH